MILMRKTSISNNRISRLNDEVFSDFIKKQKILYLRGSVFGRLAKYISTLAFNLNLGSGIRIPLRRSFHFVEIHFSYCLYLQKDLNLFNLNLILLSNVQ